MTKKRSRNLFIVFAIVLLVCLIACFVNFTYPLAIGGNIYSYSSFISNLKLGEDVGDAYRIIYRAQTDENLSNENYSQLRISTINKLKEIVQGEGYKDVTVTEYGDDMIIVTVGDLLSKSDDNTISSLIGNPVSICFSNESDGTKPFADGSDIAKLSTGSVVYEGKLYFYTQIDFKNDVKDLVAEKGEETVYIYLGENQFTEWDQGIADGYIRLYSDTFESIQDAETCANQIKTGMLDLELTQLESDRITASYGITTKVWLLVVAVVVILVCMVYLACRYFQIGLVGCSTLLFFVTLGLFFLQSIPAVHLNFGGIIALGLAFILAVDSLVNMLETVKQNYLSGSKLYVSFKSYYKDNTTQVLLKNAFVSIAGFVCMFMPSLSVQSFGWVMFILPIVNIFCHLVLMKLFTKMYLAFNSTNGNKCNFNKGGKNA